MTAARVDAGGETFDLLPEKALWWSRRRTLLVADAHFGKAQSFRRLGVAVPAGTTSAMLDELSRLLGRWDVARLVFLGDFLHSVRGRSPRLLAALERWRQRHPSVDMDLVRGNHDDRAGDPPASLRLAVHDEPLSIDGIALCHHPRPRPGAYVLAGHVHPCVWVRGGAQERLRLPCFSFGDRLAVLPAYGAFTGMHPLDAASGSRTAGERLYVVSGERVLPLPPSAR